MRILSTIVAILFALFQFTQPSFAQQQQPKPNVIFILADDLGYGDLGCYGQQKIKTPNLDALAAQGMRFTQHYAGSPVCGPSRTCLLMGRHTGHNYVRGNPGQATSKPKNGDIPQPANAFSVAKLYKQNGYRTAVIGKWGFNAPGTPGDPKIQGFDYFFGYANHGEAHEYYPDHLRRNEQRVELDGKQYSHDLIAEEALKFVRENAQQSFFLYFTPTIPHSKLQVPDIEPYTKENWPQPEKKFAAMITRMDRDIGRLTALLKELKIDQKTIVMFSSDNGPHKEGGHSPDFFDSNGPLRGIKRDTYDGGIRVPFIVSWPGHVAAGATSDHISAFWDFLPTSAELLGVSPPPNLDGISYLPSLLGKAKAHEHEALYWEFQEQGGKQGLRFGNYKAVRVDVSSNEDAPIELYDVSKDIGETTNIAAQNPELVKKAADLLEKNHEPSQLFPLFPDEIKGAPPKKPKKKKN
jgi:arylsulfatase A